MAILDTLLNIFTPDNALEKALELSEDNPQQLARLAGTSLTTARRWIAGTQQPSKTALERLTERLQASPNAYASMEDTPMLFEYTGVLKISEDIRFRSITSEILPDWQRIGRAIQAGLSENALATLLWEGYGVVPDRWQSSGLKVEVLE